MKNLKRVYTAIAPYCFLLALICMQNNIISAQANMQASLMRSSMLIWGLCMGILLYGFIYINMRYDKVNFIVCIINTLIFSIFLFQPLLFLDTHMDFASYLISGSSLLAILFVVLLLTCLHFLYMFLSKHHGSSQIDSNH